jgi:uncharacterized caspase-like protein
MDYDIKDSNVLLGFIEWQRMRDTVYDFFNNENIMPDDLLLFYYSGHGIYDDGDLYLATSEMDPYIPSRRGFNFDELRRLMNDSISTSIVTILDCCSSGSANISKGHEVDAARLARSTIEGTNFQGEGRCILAASQEQGEAFALEENNHSVFTYYLLRALKGEIQGAFDSFGHLTTDSLSKCVYYAMMSLPPSKRPKQKPIRKVEASGDIVLASYPRLVRLKEEYETGKIKANRTLSSNSSYYKEEPLVKSEFEAKAQVVESYIKKDKDFNIARCAKDTGLSINEIRAIIEYLTKKHSKHKA